jgi:ABC-type phosphate transport system auxiliary subunit
MPQKIEYIAKMEQQLEKLNLKMTQLAADAQVAKDEARDAYKEKVTKLRQQSKVAAAKLEELKTSSEDSWGTMVTDMEKMHDSFTHSFFSLFQIPTASWSQGATEKKPLTGHSAPAKKS